VRDAGPADSDVAGDGIGRADVVIEAIFENVEAKRSLFTAVEARAKPGAISRPTRRRFRSRTSRRPWPIRRGSSGSISSTGREDDAGRNRD
jgi:hypothetical protein